MHHRHLSPASSYRTQCENVFSAYQRFWYTDGAGFLLHAPHSADQLLIGGCIHCVIATAPSERLEPSQPTAAEVRSFRHPFSSSIDERPKNPFGLPLCRFFLALRPCDSKPVPANTLGNPINPVCTALSASTLNTDSGDCLASHSVGGPNAPPPPRRYGSIALSL